MDEILVIGAGRGGHGVVRRLAARGHRAFAVFDADRIEAANLPGLRLSAEWVGWPKAKELAFTTAVRFGATVRWAGVSFVPDHVDDSSPYADMIFRQRLILALSDDLWAQLAAAATAARLGIPLVALRVFPQGGGDVFAQIDVDRDPCMACFIAFLRAGTATTEPLRGRDLIVGSGDGIDDLAADVAEAVLGTDREMRRAILSPHARLGRPRAWQISPDGGATLPIFFRSDPDCPICGDLGRERRMLAGRAGVRPEGPPSRPRSQVPS